MSLQLGNSEIKLNEGALIVTETNAKGIIIFAGKDFCEIAGYTKEELVGQPHSVVRNPFMPKAAFADLWATVQRGDIWTGVVINLAKNGDYYWVKATVYPSQNVDGTTKYVSVRVKPSQIDIEEAKKTYPTL